MRVLVTGGAGAIGAYVVRALLQRGDTVSVVDSFTDYYDPALKRARVEALLKGATIFEADIADAQALERVFLQTKPERVVHLAAWAGVRQSVKYPLLYTHTNVDGTVNVLQCCVDHSVQNVVSASSSSVYGHATAPYREDAVCDTQVSPYGTSKRAGELYAQLYHYLHKLPIVCLRFFTVYGPWGRPDMAIWKFTENIHRGEPIVVHTKSADGQEVKRDFTYVEDIVQGVLSALDRNTGFDIINLSGHDPVPLLRFVHGIEAALGKTAIIEERILPPEEEIVTHADPAKSKTVLGYHPTTSVEVGVKNFADWYVGDYQKLFPNGLASSTYWTYA